MGVDLILRNRLVIVIVNFFALLSVVSCSSGSPLVIVDGGASNYKIVVPEHASPIENKSAQVLQAYIQKISGVQLQIVSEASYSAPTAIYVGKVKNSKAPRVRFDGFEIFSDADAIYIRGASGRGTLYGVYTLLEEYLGCRKYAGGEPAYVPKRKKIELPSGIRNAQSPKFVFRQTYYPASEDPEYLEWHKLHRFEDLWGVWGHSFFKLVPPEEHFAAHPEYYSQIQGRRQAIQLCLSNEEVFRLTVAYIRKAMSRYPDAVYWSISPNDEPVYCTCDRCARVDAEEGGPQGSLIRFVNRVAAEFPDHYFTTLAYGATSQAPRKTKPAPNVYVFLSSIDAYRTRPLKEESSAAEFRKNVAQWAALTNNLFIWDYTTQFTNFLCPFPDYRNVAQNIRYFEQKDVSGVFLHGSEDSYSDMAEWNSYLHAKLLWNPNLDETEVRADFMSGYYGAAANAINQYLDALYEEVVASNAKLDIYGNPINNYKDYLAPERIDRYSSILDEAEAAVEEDSVRSVRVARVRLPLEYVVLQQSRMYGTQRYGFLSLDDDGVYQVRQKWPQRIARFAKQAQSAGVKALAEFGMTPEQYVAQWNEILNHGWKTNRAHNATVSFKHAFSPDYPALRERTLTDGLFGSTDYSYNWLLFYGVDMVATIDLGDVGTLRGITAGFLYDPKHYIFVPQTINVELSEDGKTFHVVATKQLAGPTEEWQTNVSRYRFSFDQGARARFIRVTAVCPTKLPDWRYHERKLPSIACDEITVE